MENSLCNKELSPTETERYSRQIILDEMSIESQLKLKNSKVLVIGAGGLGSSCLMYISGAGIGTIGIIDNDNVDISNLPRQIIHSSVGIGINKALSAKQTLSLQNPHTIINAHQILLTNSNGLSIFNDYDLIIDCSDNPKTKYIVNDLCVVLNKPLISAGSVRWDGQMGLYVKDVKGEKLPCYRCLYPLPPDKENVKKCARVGVIGTVPGIIGAIQANEAIKFIIGLNESLMRRKMLIFDALDMRIKVIKTRDAIDSCKVCGVNREITKENIEHYDYQKFINGELAN